ncbi:MAG: hypothetical protein ACNA8S_06105 [Deferrisomatales bacterium]
MMKRWAMVLVVLFAWLCVPVVGSQALAREKVLRAVVFVPLDSPMVAMTHEWVKRVNEALAGEVRVQYLGGPEVIPGFDQVEACRNGVVARL